MIAFGLGLGRHQGGRPRTGKVDAVMLLEERVAAMLDGVKGCPDIDATLGFLASELGVSRVSLHAVDACADYFRVVGGGGEGILASGTRLPLKVSTQVCLPARGSIFRCAQFEDGCFDMPIDRVVWDMGFRSGCSVPLFMGSRPVGALCITSREVEISCDPLIDALNEVSSPFTLVLHTASMETVPRLVICHDDPLMSEGLARVLEHSLAVDVKTCSALEEAVACAESNLGATVTVICDTSFAGLGLDDLLGVLRAGGPIGAVVVFASKDSPASRMLALRGGALAYIPRGDGPGAVVTAVRNLMSGRASGFAPAGEELGGPAGSVAQLTRRESEVLVLLEHGLRFKQIAHELGISESTAKGYARNLFSKLDAHSRGEAVFEARRQGLLDLPAVALPVGVGPPR